MHIYHITYITYIIYHVLYMYYIYDICENICEKSKLVLPKLNFKICTLIIYKIYKYFKISIYFNVFRGFFSIVKFL